jgi:hypothetical protein
MDTPANQIPAFTYDIGKVPDIGEGYAKGITAAGEGISKGVTSALDVMNRSQAAHDTLDAMLGGKMLSPEAYAAIKGKSLTAQEGMIGMYANQWIRQQKQQMELQKLGYGGAVDVAKQAATIKQYQDLGLLPPGADPKKVQLNNGAGSGAGATTPVQPQLTGPQGPMTAPTVPQNVLQTTQNVAAGPLGSGADITNPGPKLGATITDPHKVLIPLGGGLRQKKDAQGVMHTFLVHPDNTWQPIEEAS